MTRIVTQSEKRRAVRSCVKEIESSSFFCRRILAVNTLPLKQYKFSIKDLGLRPVTPKTPTIGKATPSSKNFHVSVSTISLTLVNVVHCQKCITFGWYKVWRGTDIFSLGILFINGDSRQTAREREREAGEALTLFSSHLLIHYSL